MAKVFGYQLMAIDMSQVIHEPRTHLLLMNEGNICPLLRHKTTSLGRLQKRRKTWHRYLRLG